MEMTLKALRTNKGVDQKTAAKDIGVNVGTLSNWELGITFPNVPQINKLEKYYGVTYADINFLSKNIGLTEDE